MNSTKEFFEQFKQVWAQATQHIGQLQKVHKFLDYKSHNTSPRLLLNHTYEQCPLLQPFWVQVQSVPSTSHNTTFTGDTGLSWC